MIVPGVLGCLCHQFVSNLNVREVSFVAASWDWSLLNDVDVGISVQLLVILAIHVLIHH